MTIIFDTVEPADIAHPSRGKSPQLDTLLRRLSEALDANATHRRMNALLRADMFDLRQTNSSLLADISVQYRAQHNLRSGVANLCQEGRDRLDHMQQLSEEIGVLARALIAHDVVLATCCDAGSAARSELT